MINQVNNFIELNLRILYTTKNSCLNLKDFRAQVGKPFQDPKAFVRLLLIKKLVINPNEDNHCYQLTEFGKEIYAFFETLNLISFDFDRVKK